jgi:RecJ-like exonuclease
MLKRALEIANTIKRSKKVHIVTHIDADGIAAGAIAKETLQRLGKDNSIECIKQLDDTILKRLKEENHELIWFTDLGSMVEGNLKRVITDHHECNQDSPLHLNPHLFGYDGSYEISGAGATYLVSRCIDKRNMDLSPLAIVGATGDLQDKKFCKLQGINQDIVKDGRKIGLLKKKIDIRYFGRETRPIYKLLQYSNDPFIPGLSGREDACILFLQELGIPLKEGEGWRRWIDLNKEEKRRIISAIARMFLLKGFRSEIAGRIIGEIYILNKEEPGTELHDAKEFATLLNSTARYGQCEVGIRVCLGDRGKWLEKALHLLEGHRHNLVEGLQFARDECLQRKEFLQFFHAGEGIRDTIIGIVTSMMLNWVDNELPLLGLANTDNGDIKVSARATQALVDKGLNLSVALKKAAKELNCVGGGHSMAAGATIPRGKEEEFLELVEREIKLQLGL